jgi:hypothetical protein
MEFSGGCEMLKVPTAAQSPDAKQVACRREIRHEIKDFRVVCRTAVKLIDTFSHMQPALTDA